MSPAFPQPCDPVCKRLGCKLSCLTASFHKDTAQGVHRAAARQCHSYGSRIPERTPLEQSLSSHFPCSRASSAAETGCPVHSGQHTPREIHTGNSAQFVDCFSSTHEALGSISRAVQNQAHCCMPAMPPLRRQSQEAIGAEVQRSSLAAQESISK